MTPEPPWEPPAGAGPKPVPTERDGPVSPDIPAAPATPKRAAAAPPETPSGPPVPAESAELAQPEVPPAPATPKRAAAAPPETPSGPPVPAESAEPAQPEVPPAPATPKRAAATPPETPSGPPVPAESAEPAQPEAPPAPGTPERAAAAPPETPSGPPVPAESAEPAQPEVPPAPPSIPPPPPREPFWGYTDVFLFAGLAVPCMLLGYGVIHGALALLHIHLAVRAAELLAEQLAGYLFLFSALRLIFRVQYNRPFWSSLGWTDLHAPFLWLVVAGCATAVAVAFATYFIRVPNTPNPMTELLRDRASVILLATFGVTLGPLCEELAFRGFLQPLLVRSFGAIPGILLAAIPFGLLHIPEYGNSWRHGLVIALAGAAFGWVRHATGSTKAATVMHASYNALFFFVLFSQGKDFPLK